MIIDNFNVMRAAFIPAEDEAPLVVDADAVLPLAPAFQGLQPVARRNAQIAQLGGRMQHIQLSPRHALQRTKPAAWLVAEQGLGVFVAKADDHDAILFRSAE